MSDRWRAVYSRGSPGWTLLRRLVVCFVWMFCARAEAYAACGAPLAAAQMGLLLDDAEAAYGRLDDVAFTRTMDTLYARVPCLSEAPDRATVARYHRLVGLRAFLQRDEARARTAFAAARRVEPAATLSTAVVPAHHPVRDLYGAFPLEAVTTAPVPKPTSGSVSFDAEDGAERPTNVPTLFQLRGADGAVAATAYLWPLDPLPEYPSARARPPRRPMLAAAAIGGAAAVGLYAGAAAASVVYHDPDTRPSALGGLRTAVNGLNGAAIGVAVLAGGTAAVALVLPLPP